MRWALQAPPEAQDKLQELVRNSTPDGPRILMTAETRMPLFEGLRTEIKVGSWNPRTLIEI